MVLVASIRGQHVGARLQSDRGHGSRKTGVQGRRRRTPAFQPTCCFRFAWLRQLLQTFLEGIS
jgi:hypothetical protein